MHQLNTLVDHGSARLLDWAWSSRGPAWVDPAFFAVRLVGAGHTPGEAEDWVRRIPAWREADRADLDAFSSAVLGMWLFRNRFPELVDAARRYACYRAAQPKAARRAVFPPVTGSVSEVFVRSSDRPAPGLGRSV